MPILVAAACIFLLSLVGYGGAGTDGPGVPSDSVWPELAIVIFFFGRGTVDGGEPAPPGVETLDAVGPARRRVTPEDEVGSGGGTGAGAGVGAADAEVEAWAAAAGLFVRSRYAWMKASRANL